MAEGSGVHDASHVVAVEHEDPTPKRPPRFPAFDGLRAIAALLVLGVHCAFVSGFTPRYHWGIYTARLEIGVSVFFLISGFLLYRPFAVAHLAGAPRPRTGAFWLRRLLRIIPAYWVALFLITSVFHFSTIGPGGIKAYVVHYFFLQIYFWDQWQYGITQAWSLCVEMTFYLMIPIYAMAIGRWRRVRTVHQRLAAEMAGLAVLVAIGLAWRIFVIAHLAGGSHIYRLATTWLPASLDLFAFGMLLAIMSAWSHEREWEPAWLSSRWLPWTCWALAAASFWAVAHVGVPKLPIYVETFRDLPRQTLYGLFAFFLLVPAVFGPSRQGIIRKTLECWPVASLGAVSYGIYLWHQAWIDDLLTTRHLQLFNIAFWPFFGAIVVLSVATATLSYFIIEKPALRLKNSLAWWQQRGSASNEDPSAAPPDSDAPS